MFNINKAKAGAVMHSVPGGYFCWQSSVRETAWRWWLPQGTPHLWVSLIRKEGKSCLFCRCMTGFLNCNSLLLHWIIIHIQSCVYYHSSNFDFLPQILFQTKHKAKKSETCCTENQCRQMLRCILQCCRTSQRLGIHAWEDAMETCQSPGLHTLHPTEKIISVIRQWGISFKRSEEKDNRKSRKLNLNTQQCKRRWEMGSITFLSGISRRNSGGTHPWLHF